MVVTASSAPPSAIPTAELIRRAQDIITFLRRYNVERDEETSLIVMSLISAIDILLLGTHGVGKTWAIELMTDYCITDCNLFTHLCAKDQTVGEILGERDIVALERGETARIMRGMLPDCNVGYLDEIFKASPPMLNPLLDLYAKRQLKIGGTVHDCSKLLSIYMSSNELPDREDLAPFRDRIAVTKYVEPVQTPEGRKQVSRIQLGYDADGIDPTTVEPLTLNEVHQLRAAAKAVHVSDAMIDLMDTVEQQCLEAHHMISQRRKKACWRMVKTNALLRGSDSVGPRDFMVLQHMIWNLPDHVQSARNIVVKLADEFTRETERIKEKLEPVFSGISKLQSQINQADDPAAKRNELITEGMNFLEELKQFRLDARKHLKAGQAASEDVSEVEKVIAKIDESRQWTTTHVFGLDNDDDDDV